MEAIQQRWAKAWAADLAKRRLLAFWRRSSSCCSHPARVSSVCRTCGTRPGLAYDNANRKQFAYTPVGRLKEGASLVDAQREAEEVSAEIRKNFSIENTADFHIRLEPMKQYMVAQVQPAILAMMGAVIFLLLIACANVANLLLVRVSLRERELAVRTALGGSRWRLVRQMLAEALLLAATGSLLGLGLAWLGIHELRLIAPANIPRLDSVGINGEVLVILTRPWPARPQPSSSAWLRLGAPRGRT